MKRKDIHRETASKVVGILPESVTEQQRKAARTINFGLLYGNNTRDNHPCFVCNGYRLDCPRCFGAGED